MEIERKFLINNIPTQLTSYPCRNLEQAYLCTDPVVRIRKDNERYEITTKSSGALSRSETTMPLSKEAYEQLKNKSEGNIITKNRYEIPFGAYVIEFDCFLGSFLGLFYAEVEFPSEEEALSFVPPKWFGKEVTYLFEFTNAALSTLAPKDIPSFLETHR